MLRECVLLCSLWGFTLGVPPASTFDSVQAVPALVPQQPTPVDIIMNRDFNAAADPVAPASSYTGTGSVGGTGTGSVGGTGTGSVGGYSAGGYSGGGTDLGQYYYYYPVQEEEQEAPAAASSEDHVLYQPLKIITMLLIAILLQMSLPGILAQIARFLPTVVFEPLNIPWPVGGIGRDLTDTQFLSWEKLNKVTTSVRSAIESEECLPRLVCYSGHYAHGSKPLLGLLEDIDPEEYSSYVKIFKDSALRKADCNIYKCGTLGTKD